MLEKLRTYVGKTGLPHQAKDPVNESMIRHWCEAMGDFNPNYLDAEHAKHGPHKEIVSPPSMLNAWTMTGLHKNKAPHKNKASHKNKESQDPLALVNAILDEAGYVGIVATNSEHTYGQYLKINDTLSGTQTLTGVSEKKETALGIGYFITTETEYHNQNGEYIGSMLFRILRFLPGTGKMGTGKIKKESAQKQEEQAQEGKEIANEQMKRPAISMNANTQEFWNSLKHGKLSIQKCQDCDSFQHPPGVRCIKCRSKNLIWEKVSGRGKLYSHCRVHYPQPPAFSEPPIVALVELEEGVRIVSNLTDCPLEQIQIGMDLEVWFLNEGLLIPDSDVILPQFRPATPKRNETTLKIKDVSKGQQLPPCSIPITPTLIISAAIASRDYQDVHHDRDAAKQKGSPDIFMNILSSSGLVARYLSDWTGPDSIFKNLELRLGVPNYPNDCMLMSGTVKDISDNTIQISFEGNNSLGTHLSGTAELELPK